MNPAGSVSLQSQTIPMTTRRQVDESVQLKIHSSSSFMFHLHNSSWFYSRFIQHIITGSLCKILSTYSVLLLIGQWISPPSHSKSKRFTVSKLCLYSSFLLRHLVTLCFFNKTEANVNKVVIYLDQSNSHNCNVM